MKTSVLSYDQQDDIGPDTKGWLYKQGCKYKQWNKRWFVLKGIHLFYFKSPEVSKKTRPYILTTDD